MTEGHARRLAARSKVRRDEQIVADRARGLRWETIAKRHRISARQCQNIWREQRADTAEIDEPLRLVDDALSQMEAIIEQAALLAEQTANDSVHLGAINTRLRALDQMHAFMQACGVLPRNLRLMRTEVDLEKIAEALVQLLRRLGASKTDFEEAAEAFAAGTAWRRRGVPVASLADPDRNVFAVEAVVDLGPAEGRSAEKPVQN